jgi:hypothetical protein
VNKQAQQSLDEVIKATQKTTIRLQTNEAADSFGVRLSISDLPPIKDIIGPVTKLAEMLKGKANAITTKAQGPAPISIPPTTIAPSIDGNADDSWVSVPSHTIGHVAYTPPTSEADLSANFKTVYDSQALYILVDVTDDRLVSDSTESWLDDGVEVFIDADNSKSDVYGDNDYQFHFDWDATAPAVGESHHNKTNGVQYAFTRTDKGYRLEAKLPWSTLGTTPAAGKKIGLDVHVNDDDDGGDRDTKIMWFGDHDVAWQQPNAFGTAELAGLVGWWKLDESEGTKAADSSGNGHNGTVHGTPKWLPSGGKIGGALQLDGARNYVDTGYDTNLPTWTVAAWVKSPAAPKQDTPNGLVHREKNLQINWNHQQDQFRGAAAVSIGEKWYGASFGDLQADTWYHLVATLDGKSLKAYKNGVLVTTNSDASGVADTEGYRLLLGKHVVMDSYFAGTLDDVRVYNYGLAEAQVLQFYQEAK